LLVPDTLRDADRLTRLLGRDLAVLVVLHFGGERIYVPRLDVGTVVDVAKVAALTRKGLSLSEIATRLNCSERTVSRKRKQGGLMGRRARRSSAGKA
jgi:AraC-like DNA-binding protein